MTHPVILVTEPLILGSDGLHHLHHEVVVHGDGRPMPVEAVYRCGRADAAPQRLLPAAYVPEGEAHGEPRCRECADLPEFWPL